MISTWSFPIIIFEFKKSKSYCQVKGKGKGKGKVSSHSALLYLRIQWNQIAQMDRKRKNDHLSKMEPLSIHSHETSLQLKLLAKMGLGQIKRQINLQMTYKGSTTKYLLSKRLTTNIYNCGLASTICCVGRWRSIKTKAHQYSIFHQLLSQPKMFPPCCINQGNYLYTKQRRKLQRNICGVCVNIIP